MRPLFFLTVGLIVDLFSFRGIHESISNFKIQRIIDKNGNYKQNSKKILQNTTFYILEKLPYLWSFQWLHTHTYNLSLSWVATYFNLMLIQLVFIAGLITRNFHYLKPLKFEILKFKNIKFMQGVLSTFELPIKHFSGLMSSEMSSQLLACLLLELFHQNF